VRVLLDTNVLVAALVARGTCGDLLEHGVRVHTIISSRELLDELEDVLVRKLRQRKADARSAAKLFAGTFTLVVPGSLAAPVCRDQDEDRVLATALSGQCTVIVSGDRDLLVLAPFEGIRIMPPAAFWKWEAGL
jgi:putative PIN family toxin of toxin-antitoxin system